MPYLEIAGQRVWHEVSGEGEPVVLLHGGFAGASSWGANTCSLMHCKSYKPHVLRGKRL